MLAPTDLSTKSITATIIDNNNNSTTKALTTRNFLGGKAYALTETATNLNIGIGDWSSINN